MVRKKIWTKALAALLCASLAFPMLAFANGTKEDGQAEIQIEEQTENETADGIPEVPEIPETPEAPETGEDGLRATETDVLPTVEMAHVKFGVKNAPTYVPVTAGSGKYKASTVEMEIEPNIGLVLDSTRQKIDENMLSQGLFVFPMFDEEVNSGKAGLYDVRITFRDETGEVVYVDEESVKINMEEDWVLAHQKEYDLKWDGASDLVFTFDPGAGQGAITEWSKDHGVDYTDTIELHAHSGKGYGTEFTESYTMKHGTDYTLDMNGIITIKSSFLKRTASEDATFGKAEYYYFTMFAKIKGGTQPRYFVNQFSYDRSATSVAHEVTLPKEDTTLSSNEMASLVEQNKKSDVVIHTANGVDFTFAKGSMTLIEGKESYDFGTTLITDAGASGLTDISKDEFAFYIRFNYSGQLPGKAKISISLGEGSKWIGKTLYYAQTENGKIVEQVYKNVVDKNGVYTVEQSHCSDYVATTKEMPVSKDTTTAPKTGDMSYVFLLLCLAVISGGSVFGLWGVKRNTRVR